MTLTPKPNTELTNVTFLSTTVDESHGEDYSACFANDHRRFGAGDAKSVTQLEAAFGIDIKTNRCRVEYSFYNHTQSNIECLEAKLVLVGSKLKNETPVMNLETDMDKTHTFNVSKLNNGIYRINAKMTTGNKNHPDIVVPGYILVQNKEAKVCRISNVGKDELEAYMKYYEKFCSNISMEECLKTDTLSYPTTLKESYHCVKEIMDLSDEIMKKYPDASDEFKLYIFTRYIAINYAYDYYRTDVLRGVSRAMKKNNFTDPKNFMFENKVGVCWDFVNMLTIMCRHHGIPCTSMTNQLASHTWNIVYINGQWVQVDITKIVEHACYSEDTSKEKWVSAKNGGRWNYYGIVPSITEYVHEDIWEYNKPEPKRYKALGKSIHQIQQQNGYQ